MIQDIKIGQMFQLHIIEILFFHLLGKWILSRRNRLRFLRKFLRKSRRVENKFHEIRHTNFIKEAPKGHYVCIKNMKCYLETNNGWCSLGLIQSWHVIYQTTITIWLSCHSSAHLKIVACKKHRHEPNEPMSNSRHCHSPSTKV